MDTPAPLTSLIVAIYNAETYLATCLDSLIAQSYRNIEIICINDCSTDNSLSILQKYASNDSRIKIITSDTNRGTGASRNIGIDAAKGKYIRMIDSDDFIPLDSTEKLVTAAESNHSDFVLGGYRYCSINGVIGKMSPSHPNTAIANTSIEVEKKLWGGLIHIALLISAETIRNNQIYYPGEKKSEKRMLADLHFLANLIPVLYRVSIIPDTIYYYRKHPDSAIKSNKTQDFYIHYFQAIEKTYSTFTECNLVIAANYHLRYRLSSHMPDVLLPGIATSLDAKDSKEVLTSVARFFKEAKVSDLCTGTFKDSLVIPPHMKVLSELFSHERIGEVYDLLLYIGENNQEKITINKHNRQLQRQLDKKTRQLNSKIRQLANIKKTTSWKITRPVRWVGQRLKPTHD